MDNIPIWNRDRRFLNPLKESFELVDRSFWYGLRYLGHDAFRSNNADELCWINLKAALDSGKQLASPRLVSAALSPRLVHIHTCCL